MSLARVTLDDGFEFELELERNPLGVRWWSWMETRWVQPEGAPCAYEDIIGDHAVLPLGYPDAIHPYMLVALADGRFKAISAHSLFPVLDDERATFGVEAFHSEVMAKLLRQPTLL